MNIWRINLKPDMNPKYNYDDLLNYCMKNNIIGVGWKAIDIKDDDESKLWEFVNNISTYTAQEKTSGFKAVNAIRKMQEGDLIWTRVGGRASEYYLCRVDKKIWKDREMNKDLEEFEQICSWCQEHNIQHITMWTHLYNKNIKEIAQNYNINIYVHTENDADRAQRYIRNGVKGVYTDSIAKNDIITE